MNSWTRGYVDMEVPQYGDGTSNRQRTNWEDVEVESNIQDSAQAVSRGNAEDDGVIEADIRENTRAERYRAQSTGSAGISTKDMFIFDDKSYQITDEEYQNLIEEAIQQSLHTHMRLSYKARSIELDCFNTTALPYSRLEIDDEGNTGLQRAIKELRSSPLANTDEMDKF